MNNNRVRATTLNEEQTKAFAEWKRQMERRFMFAQRCEPLPHRNGSRGYFTEVYLSLIHI